MVRSWITWTLNVRPEIQRGQDARIGLTRRVSGMDCAFRLSIETTPSRLLIANEWIGLFGADRSGSCGGRGGYSSNTRSKTYLTDLQPLAGLAPGVHPIETAFDTTLIDDRTGAALLTWTERPTAALRLVEQAAPIARNRDDALAKRVLSGLTIRPTPIPVGGPSPSVTLDFDVTAPMAYWVYAEHDGDRWRLGSVVSDGTGGPLRIGLSFREPARVLTAPATVRIVFEPSTELARGSFTLTEILDHGFAIKDVPVVDTTP